MRNTYHFFSLPVTILAGSLLITTSLLPQTAQARYWAGGGYTRSNVNVNRNVNFNNNVNVNRNVNVNGGGYHGGYYGGYHGGYYHNGGVSTGTAVAIGVAGLAVGAMIASSAMPPSCVTTMFNGIAYRQCGNNWMMPQYSGSQVSYVVVNRPY